MATSGLPCFPGLGGVYGDLYRQGQGREAQVLLPLDVQGITAYQTDYSMAALTVRASGSPLQPPDGSAFNLPMATLEGKQGAA